jgi:hypothetical protein
MNKIHLLSSILGALKRSRTLAVGAALLSLNGAVFGASISLLIDPLEGTTVRNTPGRQVVGSEFFIAFHTSTDTFVFDPVIFGGGNQLRFANGLAGDIPFSANVAVLQTLDNDGDSLTLFGAGNAADLLASRITVHGPGVFVYFNQGLNLARLVYSDDLASNQADLKILARMLNLTGQAGIDGLQTFSSANFALADSSAVPEPSSLAMLTGGVALLGLGAVRRRTLVGQRLSGYFSAAGIAASARTSSNDRTFGMAGVARGQAARLNVSNVGGWGKPEERVASVIFRGDQGAPVKTNSFKALPWRSAP